MKILILHKWFVIGGSEKVLLDYLKLLQLNHQIDLLITYDLQEENKLLDKIPSSVRYKFVFTKHKIEQQKHLGQIRKTSIFYKIRYEWFKLQLNHQYKQSFLTEIKNNQYDLIIDFSGCLDTLIRQPAWSRLSKIPTIRWVHGQLNGNQAITRKQMKKFRHIFSRHRKTVTICSQMAEIISQDLDLPIQYFTTIHNPIDIQGILSAADNDLLTSELPEKYLLQVSRLAEGKGHEELIEIYAELKKHGCQHKLVFVGDGENRVVLEQLIAKYQLENDCLLVGATNNPYPYFKNASLFLHTSEHEGFGVVLLESMVFGVPVVAMACKTGPKDILGENSEYGKLIAMHDRESFINAVMELLNNPNLYQHYQQQALKRVEDFSFEQIEKQLKLLLDATQS